jgi:hypothetical protein
MSSVFGLDQPLEVRIQQNIKKKTHQPKRSKKQESPGAPARKRSASTHPEHKKVAQLVTFAKVLQTKKPASVSPLDLKITVLNDKVGKSRVPGHRKPMQTRREGKQNRPGASTVVIPGASPEPQKKSLKLQTKRSKSISTGKSSSLSSEVCESSSSFSNIARERSRVCVRFALGM